MLVIMRTCTHIIPSCMARIIVIVARWCWCVVSTNILYFHTLEINTSHFNITISTWLQRNWSTPPYWWELGAWRRSRHRHRLGVTLIVERGGGVHNWKDGEWQKCLVQQQLSLNMQLKGEHRVVSCGCYQRACMKMHEREDEVENKMTGGIVVNQVQRGIWPYGEGEELSEKGPSYVRRNLVQ